MFCVVLLPALCSRADVRRRRNGGTGVAGRAEGGARKEGGATGRPSQATPEGVKAAGIEVQTVVATTPSVLISATAVLEMNGDWGLPGQSAGDGTAVKVNASLGDRVGFGQTLAQIDSVEVDQAWSDYLKARARLDLAPRRASGVKRPSFRRRCRPRRICLRRARSSGRPRPTCCSPARSSGCWVSTWARSNQIRTERSTTIRSSPSRPPCQGLLSERLVTQGEMVGPEKTLFTVADLSTLWLMIDIYERDIGRVKTGMQTKLRLPPIRERNSGDASRTSATLCMRSHGR